MNERPSRSMVYFDGSAVRKLDYEPVRRTRPEYVPEQEPEIRQKRRQAVDASVDRALAFNLKYTVFVVASVMIMVAACIVMLYMESRINDQQNNINNLEAQLDALETDNAAYAMSLENMYTLEQINDVAVNELGMVYAKKGQIVYYDSANEDYVKQYQDVPEAN
ncbi:MAG: hypothetical protein IJX12_07420 [Lachnospiraceae bacterium]|nr:hypothetical protein [Lachnospiraceae bacterium]